jgi:Mce-associated membrane protein
VSKGTARTTVAKKTTRAKSPGVDGAVTAAAGDDGDEPATAAGDDGDEPATAGAMTGAPGDPEAASPRWWSRARRRMVANPVALAAGFVAVAVGIALVLTLSALSHQNALGGARSSALAAARSDAVELAGYDYRHLNHDFAVVVAHSAPSFRRSFTQSSDALKTTLTRYHATASAKVVSAGIVSATTSRAVVLVFLDQRITNSAQSKPTTDRSQVEITLIKVGGRWFIDQVNLL